jgi:hypothetical protein
MRPIAERLARLATDIPRGADEVVAEYEAHNRKRQSARPQSVRSSFVKRRRPPTASTS